MERRHVDLSYCDNYKSNTRPQCSSTLTLTRDFLPAHAQHAAERRAGDGRTNTYTPKCPDVPLVWGSLRLAPSSEGNSP